MNFLVGLRTVVAFAGLGYLIWLVVDWLLSAQSGLEGFVAGALLVFFLLLAAVGIYQTGEATRLLEAKYDAERTSHD